MVRSQKVGCAILAGVLILEGFLGSACSRKEKTESTTSSTETIESESEDPSSISSEETSSAVPQAPVDPVKEEALALAAELGMKEEELRGKYDLFLKYADCVVNDPKTGVFRAYALHQFPIVADHLSPENEEFFLEKVRDLRFSSQALTDASGDFNAPGDIIRFSNDGINYDDDFTFTVLFHELTHFVDAFISGPDEADLFYTGKRFAYQDDFTSDEWNNTPEGFYPCVASSFITEGGAELYMAKYHAKVASTYLCEVHFLTGFEWIYGSDALDELFFSPESSVKFVKILQDIGYTDEQICKVAASFNYETYHRIDEPQDFYRFEDVLIDMYEHEKGAGWKDDKVFLHILQAINCNYAGDHEYRHDGLASLLTPYNEFLDWTNALIDRAFPGEEVPYLGTLNVIILDGKPYLSVPVVYCNDVGVNPSAIVIDFDFDKDEIRSKEKIYYDSLKSIPEALPSGKALDDRLASFKHDNSKAHSQSAFQGAEPKMQEIYDRAAEIGNKYGVYIYLGENIPEYVQYSNRDITIATYKDMLDRIEKVLAKFPDGYFDQFNYGYYSGFEIDLVNWAVWDELYVYHTDKGYVMNISLDCKNEKVRSKMEDLLIEAIFSATDYKILNYSENFETPPFSESRWKELNPTGFYYIGFRDEDYTNETFKEWKEYVTTPEGLRYAPKDRSQLMLSLIRGDELPEGCIVKADLYCETIREAFDTDGWPEKTTWEEALAKLKGESEQKAA